MKIRYGGVEFSIDLNLPKQTKISDLTIKDLNQLLIQIKGDLPPWDIGKPKEPVHPELEKLYEAEFSRQTLVRIVKNVLNIDIPGDKLSKRFGEVSKAALSWLTRDLSKENIWALFITKAEYAGRGKRSVALGLDNKNHFVFLGISPEPAKALFQTLITRGLTANNIKFGLISFSAATPKEFSQCFPKAKVGRDWQEFIDEHEESREELEQAMVSTDIDEVRVTLGDHNGPKELLNYLTFQKDLWRVLRSLGTSRKLEQDYHRKTFKLDEDATEEFLEFLFTWTMLRLQYQWYKTPADSKVFSNLRHIKAKEDELRSHEDDDED